MPASHAFVSKPETARPILVVAPNWLGDTLMAMPGVRALQAARFGLVFDVLVKSAQADIWRLAKYKPRNILILGPGLTGIARATAAIRRNHYSEAYILPKSFRSALSPLLGGIPKRIGLPGHARNWMLTRVVRPLVAPSREHQAFECMDLLGLGDKMIEPVELCISEEARRSIKKITDASAGAPVVLAPGAKRGPSKRWPAENFAEVGRRLGETLRRPVLVVGAPAETALCRSVADMAGNAISIAGQTSLSELAAVFEAACVVVANDSGAMHLASAVGAAVVAIFGMTDPARTGPLGARAIVLQESEARNRNIARRSNKAALTLARITPQRVFDVAWKLALGNNTSNMQHPGNS